ncbi:MAG: alpha-amylase family glycosyl hydrolase [Candidatus Heimdallarchaeota archaeon]
MQCRIIGKGLETLYSVPDWVKDAIFYEIFPERYANGNPDNDPPDVEPWGGTPTRKNFFGGDLQGIIDKLDYLEALGIDAIYLTPIFAANTNHKYDPIDYYQIDPHFGDLNTFRSLLQRAHDQGIRIILDAVFNHAGVGSWAFQDVIERGENSPYVNWFYIEDLPVTRKPTPNYSTYKKAPYLAKLNVHNPEVRRYLHDVARYWTQEGIDGWRLDVPYLMNHRFWKGFRRVVKEINPELYIVAEIWKKATSWLQGDECDGAMNYRLRNLILDFFVHKKLDAAIFDRKLAALRAGHPGETAYTMLNLLGSHDTPRFLTLCGGDKELFKVAVAFLFTYVGAPMIYYGDEVGMKGRNDPDCRRPMVWDPAVQDQELLEWHRQLIHIRKAHPALRRGTIQTVHALGDVYAFERQHGADYALVILNVGVKVQTIRLPAESWRGRPTMQDEISGRVYRRSEPIEVASRSTQVLVPR